MACTYTQGPCRSNLRLFDMPKPGPRLKIPTKHNMLLCKKQATGQQISSNWPWAHAISHGSNTLVNAKENFFCLEMYKPFWPQILNMYQSGPNLWRSAITTWQQKIWIYCAHGLFKFQLQVEINVMLCHAKTGFELVAYFFPRSTGSCPHGWYQQPWSSKKSLACSKRS